MSEASVLGRVIRVLRRGDDVHLALGMLHLFTLPLLPTASAITMIMLLVYTVIRLPETRDDYQTFVTQPLPWVFLAWAAWVGTSIAWSSDPSEGLDEFGTMRYGLLLPALWPLRHRAPWLIGAALLGVAGQNLAQLVQALDWVDMQPQYARTFRVGGLVNPIQTGMWSLAAMCWYASGFLRERTRWPLWLAGGAMATAGLVASGSRGPWLAAAITLPLLAVVMPIAFPAARRRTLIMTLTIVAVATGTAAIPSVRTALLDRVESAVHEYHAAVDDHQYGTDVGLRVGLARWARQIGAKRPIVGFGAGSFEPQLLALPDHAEAIARIDEPRKRRQRKAEAFITRTHAHNAPLHLYATTGIIGVGLGVAVAGLVVVGTWRNRAIGLFDAGTPFVMIAWLIAGQFDTFHIAGQLFGMACLCGMLSMRR